MKRLLRKKEACQDVHCVWCAWWIIGHTYLFAGRCNICLSATRSSPTSSSAAVDRDDPWPSKQTQLKIFTGTSAGTLVLVVVNLVAATGYIPVDISVAFFLSPPMCVHLVACFCLESNINDRIDSSFWFLTFGCVVLNHDFLNFNWFPISRDFSISKWIFKY